MRAISRDSEAAQRKRPEAGKKAGRAGWLPKAALALLTAGFYLYGMLLYLKIPDSRAAVVFLSGSCPKQEQVKEILEAEEEKESPRRLCFFFDGGIETLSREEYARQTEALAVGVTGDAVLYDWRCQGLAREDYEGCVIDRKTALDLFGSVRAEGGTLTCRGNTYVVRRVVSWQQQMIVYRPETETEVSTQLYVLPENGESKKAAVRETLMSCGLSGTLAQEGGERIAALCCLMLLPAGLGAGLLRAALENRRAFHPGQWEYWLWSILLLLPLAVGAVLLWRTVRIPPDWIPGKWSDFDFWSEKWKELKQGFFWYLVTPKSVWQAEGLLTAGKSCAAAVVSLLLYSFFRKGKNKEKKG